MANEALLYVGSVVITLWGIAHIVPIRSVVKGFGAISEDNKQITVTAGATDSVAVSVYRACGLMLLAMAVLTRLTGAGSPIMAVKICPVVKTVVAVLFFLGSGL
ncbi:MAG: hypothetical protein NTU41_03190 [Chloroflexi bacterium]|nr:hypothetical protein [Chloroflexota bacterium]